jgi:hypothetical protein
MNRLPVYLVDTKRNEDADIFIKRELKQHFDGFNRTPPITHYKIEDFDAYKADKNLQMFYCFFSDNNAMLRKSAMGKNSL